MTNRPPLPGTNQAPLPPAPPGPGRRRLTSGGSLATFLGLLALLFAVLWIVDLTTDEGSNVPDRGVTLGDVAGDPDTYVGERVTVSGIVEERLGERLITLGDEEVAVILDSPQSLPESAVVQVEGVVEREDRDALVAEVGADADGAAEVLDEGTLTVIRASTVLVNPFETATPAPEGTEGIPGGSAQEELLAPDHVLSLSTVNEDPEAYLGQEITLGGDLRAGVAQHTAIFEGWVYDTEDILVVSGQTAPGVFPTSAQARVTGTFVEFDRAEAESRLGIELDEGSVGDYEGDLALLATSIHFFVRGIGSPNLLSSMAGHQVTMSGDIEEVISERVFRLNDNVAVILAEGVEAEPIEAAFVSVTGVAGVVGEVADGTADVDLETVPEVVARALESLTDEEREEVDGLPVVVAEEIEVTR